MQQQPISPEAAQAKKAVGRKMTLFLGLILSFFQPLVGQLTSGHFTIPGYLLSFAISAVIGLAIGFLVPIGRITRAASAKAKLPKGSLKARLLETMVSNLIFSPILSFVNVFLAYRNASAHAPAGTVKFLPMYLPSLGIGLVLGFILVFIFQPLCLKWALKRSPATERREP